MLNRSWFYKAMSDQQTIKFSAICGHVHVVITIFLPTAAYRGKIIVNSLMFAKDLFGEIRDHLQIAKINTRKHNSCT